MGPDYTRHPAHEFNNVQPPIGGAGLLAEFHIRESVDALIGRKPDAENR